MKRNQMNDGKEVGKCGEKYEKYKKKTLNVLKMAIKEQTAKGKGEKRKRKSAN